MMISSCIRGLERSPALRRSFHASANLLGGARPGGVPVFNWKQKKQLGIDEASKAAAAASSKKSRGGNNGLLESSEDFGDFDELLKSGQFANGTFVDITDKESFELFQPEVTDAAGGAVDKSRKVIKTSALFGLDKVAAPMPAAKKRQRFSHTRVFGVKRSAPVEQKA